MFNHLKTGIALAKQSFLIIQQKKTLLFFPMVSAILGLALVTIAMIPIVKVETMSWTTNRFTVNDFILCFGILIILFFIIHLISAVMNSALTICTIHHIKREPCSISSAIKIALSHFPQLFVWTLFMTTVGILIRFLEQWLERWKTLDIVVELLAGLTWLIASFFAIPVIITENTTTFQTIKRSSHLIRTTWGTSLIASASIGIMIFGAMLVSFFPAALGWIIGGKIMVTIGAMITTCLFLSVTIFSSAIRSVLISALYLYATKTDVSAFYDNQLMQKAFVTSRYPL